MYFAAGDSGALLTTLDPVPAGNYSFTISYCRSRQPTPLADDILIAAGEGLIVTLDAGLSLVTPQAGGVQGWDLIPTDS